MVEAIVVDVGGVLLENKGNNIYQKLSKDLGIGFDDFTKLSAKYNYALRMGELSASDFARIVGDEFNIKSDVYRVWKNECLTQLINTELVELVDNLYGNYKLAIISNTNDLYVDILNERGISSYFDVIINSCGVGFVKPQKEIFDITLNKLNLKSKDCVFVDDVNEFTDVARDMGFNTILYENNPQFIRELEKLSVSFD